MIEKYVQDPAAAARLRAGPFAPHLDSFLATLSAVGYARETLRKRLVFLDAFGQWLRQRRLAAAGLQETVVDAFLAARHAAGRHQHGDARTARHLLDHLRAENIIRPPAPVVDQSPLAELGRHYETYLVKERGLGPGTFPKYWACARRFIVDCFGDAPPRLRDLVPDDVSRFRT